MVRQTISVVGAGPLHVHRSIGARHSPQSRTAARPCVARIAEDRFMIEPAAQDPRLTRIMLRGELIDGGWTDRGIARMVRCGLWVKVRRGAYAVRSDWRGLDTAGRHVVRTRAVMRQANANVVASHTSGLMAYDAPTWGLSAGLSSCHSHGWQGRQGRSRCAPASRHHPRRGRGPSLGDEGDGGPQTGPRGHDRRRDGISTGRRQPPATYPGTPRSRNMRARYVKGIDRWAHTLVDRHRPAAGRSTAWRHPGSPGSSTFAIGTGCRHPIPQYQGPRSQRPGRRGRRLRLAAT